MKGLFDLEEEGGASARTITVETLEEWASLGAKALGELIKSEKYPLDAIPAMTASMAGFMLARTDFDRDQTFEAALMKSNLMSIAAFVQMCTAAKKEKKPERPPDAIVEQAIALGNELLRKLGGKP